MTSYKQFLEQIDKLSPGLAAEFLSAVDNIRMSFTLRALTAGVGRGSEEIIRLMRLDDEAFASMLLKRGDLFQSGAVDQVRALMLTAPKAYRRRSYTFDRNKQNAIEIMRRDGAAMVREISESTREAVRLVMLDGFENRRSAKQIALDLAGRLNRATGRREGGIIGLTSRQAQYVLSVREKLENLDMDYFKHTKRYKLSDSVVRRHMKEGRPIPKADIERLVRRYADGLLKYRAETIAQTETKSAYEAGRFEGFEQMVDTLGVPSQALRLGWIARSDNHTRDSHHHLHGKSVLPGTPFTTIHGNRMRFPGDRAYGAGAEDVINCRCTFDLWVDWKAMTNEPLLLQS